MSNKPRILFYFLHLLGVGHVHRAQRLIGGMVERGFAVDVIYGGEKIPGMTLDAETVHYLSPIRSADNAYSHYLDVEGKPLTREFQEQRSREIADIFETLQPDVILIEAFPFGRRMVRLELGTLLQAAASRDNPPLVISSVRDILQERKKPGRVEETVEWIDKYFDHVLVHSDPHIIELNATFPLAHQIENKLTYTGFVVPDQDYIEANDVHDIIVSAGGGAFGGALMKVALQAARKTPERQWFLLTGPNLPKEEVMFLENNKPPNVVLKSRVDNLAAHMMNAKISISQCGYNTAMDVLAAHQKSACRAIFIPYDTEGQSEQLRRAELLEEAGFAINLPQSMLNPEALLSALGKAEQLKQVNGGVNFDGVKNTAQLLVDWLSNR